MAVLLAPCQRALGEQFPQGGSHRRAWQNPATSQGEPLFLWDPGRRVWHRCTGEAGPVGELLPGEDAQWSAKDYGAGMSTEPVQWSA